MSNVVSYQDWVSQLSIKQVRALASQVGLPDPLGRDAEFLRTDLYSNVQGQELYEEIYNANS